MSDALVHIDGLQKTFPGSARPALAGVSARIKPGIVTGLVGPDGAGKTTLMRLLAGLLVPTAGRIRVQSLDPLHEPAVDLTPTPTPTPNRNPNPTPTPTPTPNPDPTDRITIESSRLLRMGPGQLEKEQVAAHEPRLGARVADPQRGGSELGCGSGEPNRLRLTEPRSGSAGFMGAEQVADDVATSCSTPEAVRESIGYMPQKFGLYEDLTVIENLALHADLRGVVGAERDAAFDRLLRFTDLAQFGTRLAGRLSGGMKQKLGLACALLGHPRLLLLDEPGVGVDPISRRELWRMVHDLIREGLTVVWSTAYLDEAELCGEVFLLHEGELLFAGNPRDLTARVAGRCWHIRESEGSRRRLLARVLRQPAVLDGVIQGQHVRMVLRAGAAAPDLDQVGAGARARVVPTPPRFEDAFIDLLGGGPPGESALVQQVRKPPDTRAAVVEAVGLTKRFGQFTAADQVTFTVRQGEVFGLLGPNGAGKSTVFRMMCGLLTPTSGTAHVMGIDLERSPSLARQRLGYMAQKFSLYGNLTVRQNLDFFSGAYGLRGARQRERVAAMTQVFKLEPYLNAAAERLPLGFKQRLALACALMHEPDLLFLDEPTSGVDPVTRREFWTHINGLVEHGVTVMVTTHFMDEAEYCDHLALVFRGQVIAAGTPDQLKDQALTAENTNPSMEDAFIELVQRQVVNRAP